MGIWVGFECIRAGFQRVMKMVRARDRAKFRKAFGVREMGCWLFKNRRDWEVG